MRAHKSISPSASYVMAAAILNAIILKQGFISQDQWYWMLLITIPVMVMAVRLHHNKT